MYGLDGPRLKIRRAISEIERLRQAEEAFGRESNYKIVRAELNPKTRQYVYRVRISREPDPNLGVFIGEIAHNLRSALDGLVYQLVILNRKTPTTSHQFPIFLKKGRLRLTKKGEIASLPQFEGRGRIMLDGIKKKHQAMIERLQPYKRISRQFFYGMRKDNSLYLLGELNNADKHRLLQVVGAKPSPTQLPPITGGNYGHGRVAFLVGGGLSANISEGIGRGFTILKDGAKITEAPLGVHVNANIIPLIAFSDGCEAVNNRAVVYTLWCIAQAVKGIVESFSLEFS